MTQITLKDVYDVVNNRMDRMEDQLVARVSTLENKVSVVEGLFNNLAGKVTIGVLVVGSVMGVLVSFIVDFIRRIKL
jgi:hypothetical protein